MFEVRTNLPDKTIVRLLFCFHDGKLFALHAFIKKTRTTPPDDLKLARKRKAEVGSG
jgi:phage-related protein